MCVLGGRDGPLYTPHPGEGPLSCLVFTVYRPNTSRFPLGLIDLVLEVTGFDSGSTFCIATGGGRGGHDAWDPAS